MERLQKVIAQSGYCSRRKAEELIKQGKVKVNGFTVTELGTKVSGADQITIGKDTLQKEDKVYYLLNKPSSTLCTNAQKGDDRHTVFDYLPKDKRLFTVGRLDYDTSGVLLVTNDGNFANKIIHPRYHLDKVYAVNLDGLLSEEDVKALRKGLATEEDTYQPAKVVIRQKDYPRGRTQLELTIQEGKNHQVKKMMEALGHSVRRLKRIRLGFLDAEGLRPGEYRRLKPYEVKKLLKEAENGKETQ